MAVRGRQIDQESKVRFRMVLRAAGLEEGHELHRRIEAIRKAHPADRPRLTKEEIRELRQPSAEAIAEVREFAESHGLEVVEVRPRRQVVVLEGTAAAVNEAFHIQLRRYLQGNTGSWYYSHDKPIEIPDELEDHVTGVLGLDKSPNLRTYAAVAGKQDEAKATTAVEGPRTCTPDEIREYYGFPEGSTGRGRKIAILAFTREEEKVGVHLSDLELFFERYLEKPWPKVHFVESEGAENRPLDKWLLPDGSVVTLAELVAAYNDPAVPLPTLMEKYPQDLFLSVKNTIEVTADTQLIAALAPGAEIEVIFEENNAEGMFNGILTALENDAEVISISWGLSEVNWLRRDLDCIGSALELAFLQGVTVCCSSGDFGATDDVEYRLPTVAFPASHQYALACGGTSLVRDADDQIEYEKVWNRDDPNLGMWVATGGGLSGYFERPDYQADLAIPSHWEDGKERAWISKGNEDNKSFEGRGVPDISANADYQSGYDFIIGGLDAVFWGTSASAPVISALIACMSEKLDVAAGWINALIYDPEIRHSFRQIVGGDNDTTGGRVPGFEAGPGWNACTGLGSPATHRLIEALEAYRNRPADDE
jgi:kumamolisin